MQETKELLWKTKQKKWDLVFHITPHGKGRPRVGRNRTLYTPEATRKFENFIKGTATSIISKSSDGKPIKEAVIVNIWFFFPIPKSYSKKKKRDCAANKILPMKTPDLDNAIKSVTDALNGVAYVDDKQIVEFHAYKRYSNHDDIGRIEVEIIEVA